MINFVDLLSSINGTGFVTIDTLTVVPLKGGKANPHQGRVTKRVQGLNVTVFQNKFVNGYENMVRRRLAAEGKDPADFEMKPRKWGERVPGMPLVKHTKDGIEKFYLEVIAQHVGDVVYYLDGTLINKSDVIGLEPAKEGEQGGLENKVSIRTFAMDSIECIRINHAELRGPFNVIL